MLPVYTKSRNKPPACKRCCLFVCMYVCVYVCSFVRSFVRSFYVYSPLLEIEMDFAPDGPTPCSLSLSLSLSLIYIYMSIYMYIRRGLEAKRHLVFFFNLTQVRFKGAIQL